MSNEDKLVTVQIKRRNVTYYLTTEEDLQNVRSNSVLGDITFSIGSLALGGIITVLLTRGTGIDLPKQTNDLLSILLWVFVVAAAIFMAFAGYFHFRSFTASNTIQSSGIVKSLGGVSHEVSSEPVKESRLEIIKAEYWTSKERMDVTEELRRKIKDNKLDVAASNAINGDPDPYTPKKLTITYRFDGITVEKEFKEDERMVIP